MSQLKIFTDGGARGNPGPAALGVVIFDKDEKLIKKFGKYLGERTNNEAEYEAVVAALAEAKKLKTKIVEMYMDSELVARQLSGIYKIKDHKMQALAIQVRNLETEFNKVTYKHIPREKNKLADAMVNEAIDKSNE